MTKILGTSAINLNDNSIKSRLESNKYYLVSAERVYDAKWFMEQIYKDIDDTNYIAVGTKETGKYEQYCCDYKRLESKIMNVLSLKDTYVSINTFWNFNRRQKNVRRLNAFFLDIDYYKVDKYKDLTTKEVIADMRKKDMFNGFEPSFFVDSGRGFYIYYLIENCSKDCTKIYKKIQNTLLKKFKEYNADKRAKDISHVLRIPGTIHSETGRIVTIIYNSKEEVEYFAKQETLRRYTLDQVVKAVLPILPYNKEEWNKIKKDIVKKKRSKKKSNKTENKIRYLFTLKNLYYSRIEDLRKLQSLRGSNCVEKCREFMCYLYRLWKLHFNGGDKEDALQNVLKFNERFTEPLSKDEVINATKSAEDAYNNYVQAIEKYNKLKTKPNLTIYLYEAGCNLYSNNTLIKELDIKEEEQELLTTIISLEIKVKKKKRYLKNYYKQNSECLNEKYKNQYRDKVGKSKKEELEEIRQKIKAMREQGLKNKEIMQMLGISSTTTFERHIKYLKTNGLL